MTETLNLDEEILAHPEWGSVNMLAMAASFGAIVPGAVAAAHSSLFLTMERHGEFSLSNGGGPLELFSEQQLAEKKEEEENDWFDAVIDVAEQRREREREEWARSEHSYAGVTMTGDEWRELSEKLKKGSPLYDWLVQEMRKNGERDPERLADLVRLKTEMQGTSKSDWTEEQKQADAYLKSHPEVEAKVADYTARVKARDVELEKGISVSTNGIKPNEAIADNSSTAVSVSAGADLFSSAPDLVKHHQAALAAVEPLDSKPVAPRPEPPSPPQRPTQVAAAIAPGSGFDA